MKRKESTVLYCNQCRRTTPHSIAGNAHTCKHCGIVKTSDGIKNRQNKGEYRTANSEQLGQWN